jgi:hypothetical protein
MSSDPATRHASRAAAVLALVGIAQACGACGGGSASPRSGTTTPAGSESSASGVAPGDEGGGDDDDGATAYLAPAAPGPALPAPPEAPFPLGTNLGLPEDWDTTQPFVDAFKTSRSWISGHTDGSWSDGRTVATDDRGWVARLRRNQIARTVLLTELPEVRTGDYTLLWKGRGELGVGGSLVDAEQVEMGDHRATVPILRSDPAGLLVVEITATDPRDPIREIRLLPPGGSCEGDPARFCAGHSDCPGQCLPFVDTYRRRPFHPDFLAALRPFAGLRFMDWMKTNEPEHPSFSDRPVPEDARWNVAGVPIEVMVALANQTGREPWFCLHHTWRPEDVRAFGALVGEALDPELRVWVELSNEVWNLRFPQARLAAEQGGEANLGEGDRFRGQLRWYSQRAVALFEAFEEGFSDRERTRRVLSGQAANPWVAEQMLAHRQAHRQVDVLAIAPYFGPAVRPDEVDDILGMGVDGLFEATRTTYLPEAAERMARHQALAQTHGLELVAYEGGQHLVGVAGAENDDRLTALLQRYNRDPRLADVYLRYLAAWEEAGGDLFMHYTLAGRPTKWGNWGALEHVRQPPAEAPKYRALIRFAGLAGD